MKNSNNEIIYVGKAKNLKNRVTSYFNSSEKSAKTHVLVKHIRSFDFIVTNSDAESYVLENNLIKDNMPKYNIRLKDDKTYPYVLINKNNNFPRLLYKRRPKRSKNIELYGPYPTGSNISSILRLLTKSFSLRDCSDNEFKSRKTPCILHQMNQCTAPCVDLISKVDYEKDLNNALNFLKGERLAKKSYAILEEKMFESANNELFEKAASIRDQLAELENFMSTSFKQDVEFLHEKDMDVISYFVGDKDVDISIYLVRHGNLLGQRNFYFSASDLFDDVENEVVQYILQYYSQHDEVLPTSIFLSVENEQSSNFEIALNNILNKDKKIQVFNKSEKYKSLENMVKTHAKEAQRVRQENEQSVYVGLNKLKELLKLKTRPRTLECYDVAIWQGKSPTAAQIVFHDGVADKSRYRHYGLTELPEGNNDYAMMREVFERRIKYQNLPDVFIVDGGTGQVNTVRKVLEELQVNIPVVGIAKSKDLKKIPSRVEIDKSDERLIIPGRSNPYILKKNMSLFRIIVQMRDEAHRFSRRLHHKKEHKRTITSWVDDVKGINDKVRSEILINQKVEFDLLKNMDIDELKKALKIDENRHLRAVHDYLKNFIN
jgi:excinuclease ABC subunit C